MKMRITLCTALALGGLMANIAVAQESNMPVFEALEMSGGHYEKGESVGRTTQCLLAMKTYDHGVMSLELGKTDSNKAVRAVESIPKLEAVLFEHSQTSTLFDIEVAKIKSDLAIFKSSDRKEQKRLFRVAKNANKTCGKHVAKIKFESLGRMRKIAELMPMMSSSDAKTCMAISGSNAASSTNIMGLLTQIIVWQRVYEKEVRREGHPVDKKVESLKIKEEVEALKGADKTRALRLYETCPKHFEKANFEYSLIKPDENAPNPYAISWD